MSIGRDPLAGWSPQSSSTPLRCLTASASPVAALVRPGPYVVVQTATSPVAR